MRVLFITSTRIGDAVLSTGLLDHLMHAHPAARFTIACGRVAEGVFGRMPQLERLIPIEKKRYGLHWLGLWAQVATTRWDLVVDLRGSAIAWLLLAKRRAVMRGGRRPGHRLLHLAQTLGISPAPRPVAWFGPAEAARAEALLPSGPPVLALGPTANWVRKVWPADRFLTLARLLTAARRRAGGGAHRRARRPRRAGTRHGPAGARRPARRDRPGRRARPARKPPPSCPAAPCSSAMIPA